MIFVCVYIIGCTLKSSSGISPDAVFRKYNFPVFESASHLCQQHVYGSSGEITWDALTTPCRASVASRIARSALLQSAIFRGCRIR